MINRSTCKKAIAPMNPKLSVVVCAYNMARELPRTIRSLSPVMQNKVQASDYEIIVVDNGSTEPFDEAACRQWGADLRVLRIDVQSASPSPARALNAGIAQARGAVIGAMIDGARIASPGLIRFALMADALATRTVILTLGFHLGPEVQMKSVPKGYNQAQEDRLLEQIRWTEDGYRLFDISVFAGSSAGGWFGPIKESNAIFMRRKLWDQLGGFDEKFQSPGGGLVNLDTLARAVQLPDVTVVTLLGEGTFHQVHGGVATNTERGPQHDAFRAEYLAIRGRRFQTPAYQSIYLGSVPTGALASIEQSAQIRLTQ
jgi:glycosyltransferase involved in cell wall biosynthesis